MIKLCRQGDRTKRKKERKKERKKSALEDNYKVYIYWYVKLYDGISLTWDYDKGVVQLSMPGYVRTALHYFKHNRPKRGKYSPYPWTPPQYGDNNHIIMDKHPFNELDTTNQKHLQKFVVKFPYYAQAI